MHAYLFIMKILRTVHSKKSKEEKQSKSLKQEAQLMLTNPRDALRDRSVKVAKHSTISYVRYFSSCAIVFKTRRFSDIRLKKRRDLEIRVSGHSRSLKVVTFYTLCPKKNCGPELWW